MIIERSVGILITAFDAKPVLRCKNYSLQLDAFQIRLKAIIRECRIIPCRIFERVQIPISRFYLSLRRKQGLTRVLWFYAEFRAYATSYRKILFTGIAKTREESTCNHRGKCEMSQLSPCTIVHTGTTKDVNTTCMGFLIFGIIGEMQQLFAKLLLTLSQRA